MGCELVSAVVEVICAAIASFFAGLRQRIVVKNCGFTGMRLRVLPVLFAWSAFARRFLAFERVPVARLLALGALTTPAALLAEAICTISSLLRYYEGSMMARVPPFLLYRFICCGDSPLVLFFFSLPAGARVP